MRVARTTTLAFIVSLGMIHAPALAQDSAGHVPADTSFLRILARIRRGDTLVDFLALRMAYARSRTYDPSSSRDARLRGLLRNAVGSGDLHAVAALSDSLLVDDPVDIDGHVMAAVAAGGLGDSVAAHKHAAIARGLGRSLDGAHRGASVQTPIVLVAVSEEEPFGRMNGLEYTDSTRLVDCPSGFCDVVVFKNPKVGSDTTIYFDVTLQVRWMLQHNKK